MTSYLDTLTVPHFTGDDATGWQQRHMHALMRPTGPERAVIGLLAGWATYADQHRAHYGSGIGADGVLGPQWMAIGEAIRGLLNGECGRLDCGTLDAFICNTLRAEDFDPDAA